MDAKVEKLLPQARAPDVSIWLAGPPIAKGAGRASILKANPLKNRFHDRAMVFQDKETRSYQGQLKYAAELAMKGRPPYDCALRCRMTAVFGVPPSKSKKFTEDALAGVVRHAVKPDDDNILKARDALKGIVFTDDSRFCESVVRKFYGLQPGLLIEVWVWQGTMI